MGLRQYNPEAVSGTWVIPLFGAIDVLQQYSQGTFVQITKDNTTFSRRQSGKTAVRVKNTNRGGQIQVTVPADSAINDLLTLIAQADGVTENQVGPLIFKDPSGNSTAICNNAFLVGPPDFQRGTEAGDNVWTWESSEIIEIHNPAKAIGA